MLKLVGLNVVEGSAAGARGPHCQQTPGAATVLTERPHCEYSPELTLPANRSRLWRMIAFVVKMAHEPCELRAQLTGEILDGPDIMKSSLVARCVAIVGLVLDLGLFAAASTYVLLPEWRVPSAKVVVLALYFAQSGLSVYGLWRAGYLAKSLPQLLHTSIKASSPTRRRTFEGQANLMGLIAVGFVYWA